MSRTDKDRPWRVQVRDYNLIQHDHTRGVCVVEDDHDHWRSWRRHWRVCAKYEWLHWECTKPDPHHAPYNWRTGGREQTCWTKVCLCPIPDDWRREPHDCGDNWMRVGCIGHRRREFHEDWPCTCDDREALATCYYREPGFVQFSIFGGGGVPRWFVNSRWNAPERRRVRDDLRDAARGWNAGDDLEDFDFPNYQHRHGARWDWQ